MPASFCLAQIGASGGNKKCQARDDASSCLYGTMMAQT